MISSYKGAMLKICHILTDAQAESSSHSNAEERAEIMYAAIEKALSIKNYYMGNFSKPRVIYCDTDSIKIKEDPKHDHSTKTVSN